MGEAWRKVPACRWYGIPAGVFEASSAGAVRLAPTGRLLPPVPDKDGYLRVKRSGRWFAVHVLVCLAFHGLPEVLHLGDGNQDNIPAKLEWGTRRKNERGKRGNGRGENGREGYPPVPAVTLVTGDLPG